ADFSCAKTDNPIRGTAVPRRDHTPSLSASSTASRGRSRQHPDRTRLLCSVQSEPSHESYGDVALVSAAGVAGPGGRGRAKPVGSWTASPSARRSVELDPYQPA